MNVERNQLVELLRSRGNDQTAERAERTLPQHIDLHRHRQILRQCGIDPVVLAFTLSRHARATDMADRPAQRATGDDDSEDRPTTAGAVPRTIRDQGEPSVTEYRTTLRTASGGLLSLQSPTNSHQQADQMTRSTSDSKPAAGFHISPRPVIRCPRCRVAFGSAELMLEHLNDHHLKARHQTDMPVDGDSEEQEVAAIPDDEIARLHGF